MLTRFCSSDAFQQNSIFTNTKRRFIDAFKNPPYDELSGYFLKSVDVVGDDDDEEGGGGGAGGGNVMTIVALNECLLKKSVLRLPLDIRI